MSVSFLELWEKWVKLKF